MKIAFIFHGTFFTIFFNQLKIITMLRILQKKVFKMSLKASVKKFTSDQPKNIV